MTTKRSPLVLSESLLAAEVQRSAADIEAPGIGDQVVRIESPVLHAKAASFFDFFMRFGVRVPLIVQRQDSDVQSKIRREVDARAARYLEDGTYKIPMPSLIVSGQRPFE